MVSQPVVVYPATRIIMSDAYDLVQPWRKTFPICRPPIPGDKADAHRFAREFEEGLDQEDAGQSWTLGGVMSLQASTIAASSCTRRLVPLVV